jgi:hypothetical protein
VNEWGKGREKNLRYMGKKSWESRRERAIGAERRDKDDPPFLVWEPEREVVFIGRKMA